MLRQAKQRYGSGFAFGPCLYLMRLSIEDLQSVDARLGLKKQPESMSVGNGKGGVHWSEADG